MLSGKGKYNDALTSVELSADGSILVVVKEKSLELWNTVDGVLLRTLRSRGEPESWDCCLTKDGTSVVMAIAQVKASRVVGVEIDLVSVKSGKVLATKKVQSGPGERALGLSPFLSPLGDLVAFQVDSGEIALWRSTAFLPSFGINED